MKLEKGQRFIYSTHKNGQEPHRNGQEVYLVENYENLIGHKEVVKIIFPDGHMLEVPILDIDRSDIWGK